MPRIATAALLATLLASCGAKALQEDLSEMPKWRLCHVFADYTFAASAEALLLARDEIRLRNWDHDPDCELVYESRMTQLTRDDKKSYVPWPIAIGVGNSIPGGRR